MNRKAYRYWTGLAGFGLAIVCLLTACRSTPTKGSAVSKGAAPAGQRAGQGLALTEAVADLDYFFRMVEEVHYNFLANMSKGDYELLKDRLAKSLTQSAATNRGQVDKRVLALTVSEAAAAFGDGHTYCHLGSDLLEGSDDVECMPPFRMDLRAGQVVISETVSELQQWKGAQLVEINGQSLKEALRPILQRISGERWEHRMADFLRGQELYWALVRPIMGKEMTLRLREGKEEPQEVRVGLISRARYKKEVPAQSPLANFTFHRFYDHDQVCYWHYNSCNFTPQGREAIERVFREIQERHASKLVLDLRFNPGGNDAASRAIIDHLTTKRYRIYSRLGGRISDAFLRQTPQWYLRPLEGMKIAFPMRAKKPKQVANRFEGEVYVLTSAYTFSAGADLAHALKDYKLATLIGEETGGVRQSFGEALGGRLPNSRLGFSVSCKVFYAPIPNSEDSKRGTVPDIVLTGELLGPFMEKADPELEFTLDLILQKRVTGR